MDHPDAQELLWTAIRDVDAEGIVRAHQAGANVVGVVCMPDANSLIRLVRFWSQKKLNNIHQQHAVQALKSTEAFDLLDKAYAQADACVDALVACGHNPLAGRGPEDVSLWPVVRSRGFNTMVQSCLINGFVDDSQGTVMHALCRLHDPTDHVARALDLGGSLTSINVWGHTPLHVLWDTQCQRARGFGLQGAMRTTQMLVDRADVDLLAADRAGVVVADMMDAACVPLHMNGMDEARREELRCLVSMLTTAARLKRAVVVPNENRGLLKM